MIKLFQSPVYFSDMIHGYLHPDGKELMGVTSLMKKHNLNPSDYATIDPAILARAAAKGSVVHKLLEDYDNGEVVNTTPELQAYIQMKQEFGFKVLCSEYLVSDNEIVASKVDKVLDDYTLVDVKTTSKVYTESLQWQLSIYAYLFEHQNPGIKVPKLLAWHVRDGKCKSHEINRLPDSHVEALLLYEKEHGKDKESQFVPPVLATVPILSKKDEKVLFTAESAILKFQKQMKAYEEIKKALFEKLYEEMSAHNIKKISCDKFDITLTEPYTKQAVDGKLLKEKYPKIALEVVKTSSVKGSIKITLKKDE